MAALKVNSHQERAGGPSGRGGRGVHTESGRAKRVQACTQGNVSAIDMQRTHRDRYHPIGSCFSATLRAVERSE